MTNLVGTLTLARLALRRDRIQLPVWLLGISLMLMAVAATIEGLYTTAEERTTAVAFSAGNVVARVFDGPASGTSVGAVTVVESFLLLAVLTALMSTFAVVRHTRQNEESGRTELVGATVVGRHAPLTAALLVVVGANLVLGGLVAVLLVVTGLEVTGSIATGAALGAVGAVFAGVAAVTAQVFESARAANGAAAGVVGLAVLLRGIGDALGEVADSGVEVVSAWPSWLSPIGWGQQMRPFHQDNWEVLALFVGLLLLLVPVAFWLTSHRDVGTGMLGVRRGPARASERLLSPLGLAWRLQRGVLVGWMVGMAIVAAAFGALGDEAADFGEISEEFVAALEAMAPGAGLVDAYHALAIGMVGTIVGGFVVQSLLRMRAEEAGGALEPLLATAVSRPRWMASHVAIAVGGVVVIMLVSGLAAGLAYGVAVGDLTSGPGPLVGAALVQVPASLALGGFVVVAYALLPRWAAALGWTALVVCLLVGQIGALLELPQAALNVSPYTHVPGVPAVDLAVGPIVVLLAAAAVLGAAGAVAFRRRDLTI